MKNLKTISLALTHRKAVLSDLPKIIALFLEDDLSKTREKPTEKLDPRYVEAFHRINADPNQYLMVVEQAGEVIATCHLTIIPSLTFVGSNRLQVEGVHVAEKYRGQKIGEWMMHIAIEYGKSKSASIIQLTSNKKRLRAKNFYERLGFIASHEGFKLYLDSEKI